VRIASFFFITVLLLLSSGERVSSRGCGEASVTPESKSLARSIRGENAAAGLSGTGLGGGVGLAGREKLRGLVRISGVASLLPARRASKVDPTAALHCE
jgi:hypothetical protein